MNNEYRSAQEKAYKILKNKKPYAVIYAYSQGDGKVILNPPLVKHSQQQVNAFVNSFRRPRQSTQVTVDVFYLSQLDRLEDIFEEEYISEEQEVQMDSVDGEWVSGLLKDLQETTNSIFRTSTQTKSAKIIEDLNTYEPWSGAIDTWEIVKTAGKVEELDFLLEDMYPNGIEATDLNDLLWSESSWIYDMLDIDVDEIKERIASGSKVTSEEE